FLLTHSSSAVYETVLRSFEPAHGDFIIASALSDPMLSLVAVCMGVSPVFCDIEPDAVTISAKSLEETLNNIDISRVKAVVIDFPGGVIPDIAAIAMICKNRRLPLVFNAGDAFNALYDTGPLTQYADAVIYDLGSNSALNIGNGGAVLTDNPDIYTGASAYHHCGNSVDVGSSLDLKDIAGGDFRITEFQACLVEETIPEADKTIKMRAKKAEETVINLSSEYLVPVNAGKQTSDNAVFFKYISEKNDSISIDDFIEKSHQSGIILNKVECMHHQPVFGSEYFRKMTGYADIPYKASYRNALFAEQNYIRRDL
ncbi:MAG: DegT/DnrJ/EryC1/StrS family aminotransferase, partial [Eubacteriales bacterium]|nr:DegT/DnrJ/EryC1/StrS family aminotransferase [Eubacteriales bacterium]